MTATMTEAGTADLVVLAAQWDAVVPCKTASCEEEATHVLGVRHSKGAPCEETVNYPACPACRRALWIRSYELVATPYPCVGCGITTTDVTDYIRYDRKL